MVSDKSTGPAWTRWVSLDLGTTGWRTNELRLNRTEMMDTDTLALIPGCWPPAGCCLDLTGGAQTAERVFAAWCAR
jgi:hypothetical protein